MEGKEKKEAETIRRAGLPDVDGVWEIIRECSEDLAAAGYFHWQKYYTRELVEKMIAKREVYLYGDSGTVTFWNKGPYYYSEADRQSFSDSDEPGLFIMALGVRPSEQGKGIAGKFIDFAFAEAKNRGVKWLRLDCREIPSLVRFYENRGFKRVGRMEEDNNGVTEVYLLMERQV